ncbi:uncharacterized protein LOC115320861 [Ixodes scapularis]|uniref:uncharacterized protein LOC115320861 n=1 Tax=Ixodes scapularis TaxID=6945 RepID=UPI001C38A361|nr:uncharacterized protein LOC115312838 isoform X3 [Ixodes scapularis]XP_042144024.1 uncharacterized protein LOC115320861 [Ixodes scapularis]
MTLKIITHSQYLKASKAGSYELDDASFHLADLADLDVQPAVPTDIFLEERHETHVPSMVIGCSFWHSQQAAKSSMNKMNRKRCPATSKLMTAPLHHAVPRCQIVCQRQAVPRRQATSLMHQMSLRDFAQRFPPTRTKCLTTTRRCQCRLTTWTSKPGKHGVLFSLIWAAMPKQKRIIESAAFVNTGLQSSAGLNTVQQKMQPFAFVVGRFRRAVVPKHI